MCEFIRIKINKKTLTCANIAYLPSILALFKKYSKFLCDDYFYENKKTKFEMLLDLIEKCGDCFWVILEKKSGIFAGFVYLDNFVGSSENLHSAEITTCIEKKFWGAFTKKAAKKFIKYVFAVLNLKKLKACVFEQNFRVKAILKSAGFEKEATLKAETLKNNELQNIDVYSIVKNKEIKNEN